jgi:hypothetical protein
MKAVGAAAGAAVPVEVAGAEIERVPTTDA